MSVMDVRRKCQNSFTKISTAKYISTSNKLHQRFCKHRCCFNNNIQENHLSSGPDKIPRKLLAYEVSPCLALLFSTSLQQSIVPSDWKKATVCPIFKKGDQKKNCCQLQTSFFNSKIMEHVVYSNVMSHLERHDILTHH